MKESLGNAISNTEVVYNDLKVIADQMFNAWAEDLNATVERAKAVNELTNDQIRRLIFELSTKSFTFGETKERASVKAAIAESLRKEAYAREYNKAEGAVAARDTTATAAISSEVLTETIYELVANLFKVKLDECHRLVDALKTILMSRVTEMRISATLAESIE